MNNRAPTNDKIAIKQINSIRKHEWKNCMNNTNNEKRNHEWATHNGSRDTVGWKKIGLIASADSLDAADDTIYLPVNYIP